MGKGKRVRGQRAPERHPSRRPRALTELVVRPGICQLFHDQPRGPFYETWIDCTAPRFVEHIPAMTARLYEETVFYASVYGAKIPLDAALWLDVSIDADVLLVEMPDVSITAHMWSALLQRGSVDGSKTTIRREVHEMHASGLCVVTGSEETPVWRMRHPVAELRSMLAQYPVMA